MDRPGRFLVDRFLWAAHLRASCPSQQAAQGFRCLRGGSPGKLGSLSIEHIAQGLALTPPGVLYGCPGLTCHSHRWSPWWYRPHFGDDVTGTLGPLFPILHNSLEREQSPKEVKEVCPQLVGCVFGWVRDPGLDG